MRTDKTWSIDISSSLNHHDFISISINNLLVSMQNMISFGTECLWLETCFSIKEIQLDCCDLIVLRGMISCSFYQHCVVLK